MKTNLILLSFLFLQLIGFSQKGLYVRYDIKIKGVTEETVPIADMMEGSFMELAISSQRVYVSTDMIFQKTEIETNEETNIMTMYLSGSVGNMAFRGNQKEFEEASEETYEKEDDPEIIYYKETKKILGYVCKKAVIRNAGGTSNTFWYTEKIKPVKGLDQFPNQLPGLCLQMEIESENLNMVFTASEVKVEIDISQYTITIPEGDEIRPLTDLLEF